MFKDRYILIIVAVIFIIVLIGGIILVTNDDKNETKVIDDGISTDDSNEDYNLNANYIGDNTWNYVITGYKPSSCYETQVSTIVAESFPEQVTVQLTLIAPEPEVVCTLMIEELKLDGTFSASEGASVKLDVIEE